MVFSPFFAFSLPFPHCVVLRSSFDDSSSLSSGISDPWNEVYGLHQKVVADWFIRLLLCQLTGLDVEQMEQSSVYPGYGTPLLNRRQVQQPAVASETSPYK